jgi:phenylalanyl-tRNA synthetase alpha chain
MLKEGVPVRILSPGRTFRRDTADATHSANFHQLEGLFVSEQVKVTDLKALLDYFAKELLGKDAKVRFRPHFFPYTEPSFEVDFSAEHLGKVGKKVDRDHGLRHG